MKDVRDNIFSFLDDWYGQLNDIIEDLKEHDFDVLNATNEWIDASKDDKEYVLKLGGTERTITIDKVESLNESINSEKVIYDKVIAKYLDGDGLSEIAADLNITIADVKVCIDEYKTTRKNKHLTEGGIYPVAMVGGADDAFLKVINEILGGNITEVNNLELIPALGFGGSGRYWYRASITLDEDTIVNFISEESTPEAKRLLDAETLVINPYSDISIDCSANSVQYQDGTTLDALNDSDADMKTLDNESDIIGNAIISKLVEAEDKIIEVLKKYEEEDGYDGVDYIDEPEYESDDTVNYIDESLIPIEEASHPKLGKRVKSLKGWKIYQGTTNEGDEIFRCFTPDEDRPAIGYEDWECETLEQAISWIENYDLEESKKPTNESNKDDLTNVSEGDLNDSSDGRIVIEKDTFGNYEENIFGALDNIEILVSSYEEVNSDTLKTLIDRLEDEIDTLKKINMKLITGIKQYTL